MPLYDFRCQTCGVFEQKRSIAEASNPIPCPSCQAVAKRIISAVGVVKTPSAISQRVEQSAEPRVVQRTAKHDHSHHNHQHRGRPWAIGH
ncbi:FmdB family zinc ribbon protein [Aliterella atlantica]|uniref:Regulatory protein, FmdB family n=1 Tax=Aliterella atlantica CENA595 TaxID=1618023 RepID=A0A0D8ZWE5_9CYAN|nr:zinc ribbon domain-containing protein [Aliterella atlantica]KJH72697.1 regulatory protein, FmdB family [Aliterella atlantica CENA595]